MIEQDTPMMKQFKEIKEKYPDAFLFFRCGDFYEMFGTDAINASAILDITLTKRGDVPMCGVPYHSVDIYIAKMINAGKKIAICEQVEDPKLAKGIVKREVTQVITPGTLVEEKLLENKSNNFIMAINTKGLYIELSYLDLSTGDFEIVEIEYDSDLSLLKGEMIRIMPREIIIPEDIFLNDNKLRELFEEMNNVLINRFPHWHFNSEEIRNTFFKHLSVKSWEELNIYDYKTDLTTPYAIYHYVSENAKTVLDHIKTITYSNMRDTMLLDETTIKNLELLKNLRDDTKTNSLLEILDYTTTSMGGRLLKKWIITPLINLDKIQERQNIVSYLYHNQDILNKIEKFLKQIMDLERLSARIVMNRATPKDLISIKISLINVHEIFKLIKNINELKFLFSKFQSLVDLIEIIENAIKDDPSTSINEGNIVKEGYNSGLDNLKKINLESKEYILEIEQRERKKFNLQTLRIKYNKILGYFFEISRIQSKGLDNTYILRQSLVNTCRYTTQELSEYESKVLTAREEINEIEESIFNDVRNKILVKIQEIQCNAKIIANIDVLLSFANVAISKHYIKPVLGNFNHINIKEGRHPVVEQKLELNEFISNDLEMNIDKDYILIITGPNMSGKSTYLRQNALIVLLAQIGSFVPAYDAQIGIVDRIFTRIGTSDNLARGQSTFLVEMLETSNILRKATDKSLIIMDEIGRGTSTYDGLAIAWAVIEYIYNKKTLGAKTLFATHYHELTNLDKNKGIKNLSIAISEENENITFLHKIIEEPAEKSYGIHVASLANMPEEVIQYAEGILKNLEENKENKKNIQKVIDNFQLELFNIDEVKLKRKTHEIIDNIKYLDLSKITPIDSLNILNDLQKKIKKDY